MHRPSLALALLIGCAHARPVRPPPPPAPAPSADDTLTAQVRELRTLLAVLRADDPRRPATLARYATTLLDLAARRHADAVRIDPRAASVPRLGRPAPTAPSDAPPSPDEALARWAPAHHDPTATAALAAPAADALRTEDALTEEALHQYQRLIDEHPRDAHADRALFEYAALWDSLGDAASARQVYFLLIRTHPESPYVANAYVAFGDHFFAQGQLDLAREAYTHALALEASEVTPYARYKLGWTLFNLSRFADALEALRRAAIEGDALRNPTVAREARRDAVMVYRSAQQPVTAAGAVAFVESLYPNDAPRVDAALASTATELDEAGRGSEAIDLWHALGERLPARRCEFQQRAAASATQDRTGAAQRSETARAVTLGCH